MRGKLLGRVTDRVDRISSQAGLKIRALDYAHHVLVNFTDDFARSAGGGHETVPSGDFEAGERFCDSAHVREKIGTLGSCDTQGLQFAALCEPNARGNTAHYQRNLVGEHIGDTLTKTFVGDMQHINAPHGFDGFHGEVLLAPCARRCVAQLARLRFGERQQFLDVVGRKRRVGQDDEGPGCRVDDRREVLDRIVGIFRIEQRRNGNRRVGCEQQRVAVWHRLGNKIGANSARGSGFVLDNNRLLPQVGEFLRQHTAVDIGCATGRESDNDFDWFVRISLRKPNAGSQR